MQPHTDADVRLIDAAAVARLYSVTGKTVRNWIFAGRVNAVRTLSGRWKITPAEYDRLKKKAETTETPEIHLT